MLSAVLLTIPVFLIIGAGWAAARSGIATEGWVSTLNSFVYYIALPSLIIMGFWEVQFPGDALFQFVVLHLLVLAAVAGITAAVLAMINAQRTVKASVFMGVVMGNTIYMGLPVGTRAFGSGAESPIVLSATIFLLAGLFASLVYLEVLKKGEQSLRAHLKNFSRDPLIIALIAGAVLNAAPFAPGAVDTVSSALDMLGGTASPVALFALGVFFSGASLRSRFGWVAAASAGKLLLFPAITIGVIMLYRNASFAAPLDQLLTDIPLVIAAMPAAVTTFVLAERFNLDRTVAANTIIVSTILSFVTLTTLLAFL